MPELPDVEGHRRLFSQHAAGKVVDHVEVPDPDLLVGTTPQGLGLGLRDRPFTQPRRHGKWLVAPTDGGPALVFHFRMTGELVWGSTGQDRSEYDAVILVFDDGEMRYRSRRRLGRVHFVPTGDDPATVTGPLGPDAADLDRETLAQVLADRHGMVKPGLLDQERVAGLGNELVDDILWRARLHPRTPADELNEDQIDALHGALHDVLDRAVAAGHVPSGPDWINGQRGVDEPRCPRCGAALEQAQVGGRTTLWCPRDQPSEGR